MKKLISIVGSLAVLALSAQAANFQKIPFFNGFNVIVTNNSTVLYNATNVYYINKDYQLSYSYQSNVVNPTIYSGTNLVPQTVAVQKGAIFDSSLTYYWTNTAVTNAFSFLNQRAWEDQPLWADANGNAAPINLSVAMLLESADGTNRVTFTFRKLASGLPQPAPATQGVFPSTVAGTGLDTFTWVVDVTGVTNTVASTNLPSIFTSGAGGIRLDSIVTANSSTNLWVKLPGMWLSGYKP